MCRLPTIEPAQVKLFRDEHHTIGWLDGFLRRHPEVEVRHMKVVDQERVEAFTLLLEVEHLSRMQEAMVQYGIYDTKLIFNSNEISVYFNKISSSSILKGVGIRERALYSRTASIKGTLDRMIIMPIIAASCEAFKLFIGMTGK